MNEHDEGFAWVGDARWVGRLRGRRHGSSVPVEDIRTGYVHNMPSHRLEDVRPTEGVEWLVVLLEAERESSASEAERRRQMEEALRACLESLEHIEREMLPEGEKFAEWSHPAISMRMARRVLESSAEAGQSSTRSERSEKG